MKAVLLFFMILASAHSAERIMLYSQYDSPPFYLENGQGLTFDLAKELSQRSAGRYEFIVQITPRKRLDFIVANPKWQGIIPWVTPSWFNDEAKTHYVWSERLMRDSDLVLSAHPILYNSPESLIGQRFGGVLGHRYGEIEALIQAGQLIREDAPSQTSNLKKMQSQRVDVIFFPHSSWSELKINSSSLTAGVFVAHKARSQYDRLLLISPNNPELIKYTLHAVEELNHDLLWKKRLSPFSYNEK
jgi:polar amino acid transport system substrate-binding protein